MGSLVDAGVVKLTLNDNWLTVELSSGLLFGSGSAFVVPMPIRAKYSFKYSETGR